MKILGIETSCDETAVALLEAEGTTEHPSFHVLGNALYSQASLHKEYGGVYPNLAKREHAKNIVPLLAKALTQAGTTSTGEIPSITPAQSSRVEAILAREPALCHELLEFVRMYPKPDIDAIAVTEGPGLAPALWIGVNAAEALSVLWNIPAFGVNHMEGHVLSSLATTEDDVHYEVRSFSFPLLALLISGGHTELVLMEGWHAYALIGRTRDDAVGEAFDKVARTLGLPYPGGPHISRLAAHARKTKGKRGAHTLPRPMLRSDDCDFSFAGLKTAVLYAVKGQKLNEEDQHELAREFEDAVTEVLVEKTRKALEQSAARTFVVGGGVAANAHIRDALAQMITADFSDTAIRLPSIAITGDNAIMIGVAGYYRLLSGTLPKNKLLAAQANLRIDE